MSEINISRRHGKTLAKARKAAQHMSAELEADLDMTATWEGDVLSFERPGVKGTMTVDAQEVRIELTRAIDAELPRGDHRQAAKVTDVDLVLVGIRLREGSFTDELEGYPREVLSE